MKVFSFDMVCFIPAFLLTLVPPKKSYPALHMLHITWGKWRWVMNHSCSLGPLDDSSIKEWTNSTLLCCPKTSPDSKQAVEMRHDLQNYDPRGCKAQPHPAAFLSFKCLAKKPKWSHKQWEIMPRLSNSLCSVPYDLYKELQTHMSENREGGLEQELLAAQGYYDLSI